MDKLVKTPKSAIREITEAQYLACSQKKPADWVAQYKPLDTRALSPVQAPEMIPLVEGSKAIVVENPAQPEPPQVEEAKPLESSEEALDIGKVD